MRLHSNFLETSDFYRAARTAGVSFTRFETKGSRKRDRAFDVILTGTSPRNQNFGGEDKAATWDEWGVFLGVLFGIDPEAVTPYYSCGADFHWQTGNRFFWIRPAHQRHRQHRWEWSGRAATGAYTVHECKCGALMRRGDFAAVSA